jgi:choline dehydrogenase
VSYTCVCLDLLPLVVPGIPVVVDLPGVGQNLQNHVSVGLQFSVEGDDNVNRLDMPALQQLISSGTGPMTSTGLSQVYFRVT